MDKSTTGKPNRKSIRLKGYDYNNVGAYFVTICTKNRRCLLASVGTGVLDGPHPRLTAYGATAEKYLLQFNDFYNHIQVEHYVIMPNHIHLLLVISGPTRTPVPTGDSFTDTPLTSPNTSHSLSTVSQYVSTLKRFCNKEYGENIWQPRSYDHIIRNKEDYEAHVKYIYENPMHWRYDQLYTKN